MAETTELTERVSRWAAAIPLHLLQWFRCESARSAHRRRRRSIHGNASSTPTTRWRRPIGVWAGDLSGDTDDPHWERFVERSARWLRRLAMRFDSAMNGVRSAVGNAPAEIGALTPAAMALLHERMALRRNPD